MPVSVVVFHSFFSSVFFIHLFDVSSPDDFSRGHDDNDDQTRKKEQLIIGSFSEYCWKTHYHHQHYSSLYDNRSF